MGNRRPEAASPRAEERQNRSDPDTDGYSPDERIYLLSILIDLIDVNPEIARVFSFVGEAVTLRKTRRFARADKEEANKNERGE